MFHRGRLRIVSEVTTDPVRVRLRTVSVNTFYVALGDADLAELRSIASPERRLDFVFDNADARWTGYDYLYIEGQAETIHRLLVRHPPVERLDTAFGPAPERHVVFGHEALVEWYSVLHSAIVLEGQINDEAPIPGDRLDADWLRPNGDGVRRRYRLGLIENERLPEAAGAMPDATLDEFTIGYRAHADPHDAAFGPDDCRIAYGFYLGVQRFLRRHAATGKHVVIAREI